MNKSNKININFKDNKCFNCLRTLPNKDFKTKNGCKWCDIELAKKELK